MASQVQRTASRLKVSSEWRRDSEQMLAQVCPKSRESFDRYNQACEDKLPPEVRERWHRLSRLMLSLAPALPKSVGSNTMMFFIPDGQYRKQVFALHARKDGTLVVCAGDVIENACRDKLLTRPTRTDPPSAFHAAGGHPLSVEAVDGKTPNQEPFYQNLTGWNRRAMRITLPPTASSAQVEAAEALCALSAAEWLCEAQ